MYERTWSRVGASLPMPKGAEKAQRRMDIAMNRIALVPKMLQCLRRIAAETGDAEAVELVRMADGGVE